MTVRKTRNVYNIDKPIYEFEILDTGKNVVGIIKIPLQELIEATADERYILEKWVKSTKSL